MAARFGAFERRIGICLAIVFLCLANMGCLFLSSRGQWPAVESWTEESLCRHPWKTIEVFDDKHRPVRDALVWTEAFVRNGSEAMGEVVAINHVIRGPASRTNARGRARYCDITEPLVAAYGERGVSSEGLGGRGWCSIRALKVFVGVGDRFVQVPLLTSARWGEVERRPSPTVVQLDFDANSVVPVRWPSLNGGLWDLVAPAATRTLPATGAGP